MDQMVLRPAEGVAEEQTQVDHMPWLERSKRGWIKSWFATVGQALVTPPRLMRSVPESSSIGQAWWFGILTTSLFIFTGWAIPIALLGLMLGLFRSGGAVTVLPMSGLVVFLSVEVCLIVLLAVWGLVTHGVLRLTGGSSGSIGRTYQALWYSSGAAALLAVPIAGIYPCGFIPLIWWVVSAILMVAEGHRVHGGRAALATLTFPVVLVLLVIGGYGVFLVAIFSGMGTMSAGMMMPTADTQIVLDGVLDYASGHDGQGPGHALQLVTSAGLSETDFVTSGSATGIDDVPAGDADLVSFMLLSTGDQAEVADAAADALPRGIIAHRLGDFVFTYHGIDLTTVDPGLWVVVQSPDPDVNSVQSPWVVFGVGRADGTVVTVGLTQMAMSLRQQNAIRDASGLPALPDPTMVTHDAPAVAEADRSDE